MECPFAHNRAMNVIGQVLDKEQEYQIEAARIGLCDGTLEYRIAVKLEQRGFSLKKLLKSLA